MIFLMNEKTTSNQNLEYQENTTTFLIKYA